MDITVQKIQPGQSLVTVNGKQRFRLDREHDDRWTILELRRSWNPAFSSMPVVIGTFDTYEEAEKAVRSMVGGFPSRAGQHKVELVESSFPAHRGSKPRSRAVQRLLRSGVGRGDFRDADFRNADLSGLDLRWKNFEGANFRDANLQSADLSSARLTSANFANADLRGANLNDADVHSADFTNADLRGSKFGKSWGQYDYDRGWSSAVFGNAKLLDDRAANSKSLFPEVVDEWLDQNTNTGLNLGDRRAWLIKRRYQQVVTPAYGRQLQKGISAVFPKRSAFHVMRDDIDKKKRGKRDSAFKTSNRSF